MIQNNVTKYFGRIINSFIWTYFFSRRCTIYRGLVSLTHTVYRNSYLFQSIRTIIFESLVYFQDNWSAALRDILDNKGYIKLKSIRLQGLLLSVFSLRKHLLNIREIESEYTRTGLAGMWVSF